MCGFFTARNSRRFLRHRLNRFISRWAIGLSLTQQILDRWLEKVNKWTWAMLSSWEILKIIGLWVKRTSPRTKDEQPDSIFMGLTFLMQAAVTWTHVIWMSGQRRGTLPIWPLAHGGLDVPAEPGAACARLHPSDITHHSFIAEELCSSFSLSPQHIWQTLKRRALPPGTARSPYRRAKFAWGSHTCCFDLVPAFSFPSFLKERSKVSSILTTSWRRYLMTSCHNFQVYTLYLFIYFMVFAHLNTTESETLDEPKVVGMLLWLWSFINSSIRCILTFDIFLHILNI